MNSFLLDRAELAYLLGIVGDGGGEIVGIPAAQIFPDAPALREQEAKRGEESLLRRHLILLRRDGRPVIDVTLATLVTAMAQPDLAIIAIRHVPPLGPQLFLLYVADQFVVEHTSPVEGSHRLDLIGDRHALVPRLMQILSIPEQHEQPYTGSMDQAAFFEMKRLAESGQQDEASAMLRAAGFAPDEIAALVAAIAHPRVNSTVAVLRCARSAILDARNIAVVADDRSAWLAEQQIPGEPVLDVRTTDVADARLTVARHLDALAQIPA